MAPRAHTTNSINDDQAISSQTHETCNMHDNEWTNFNGIVRYSAPNNGASGIAVERDVSQSEDSRRWKRWVTLPPVAGRFEGPDGLMYLIPKAWGGMSSVKAAELRKGDPLLTLGYDEAYAEMTGHDGKTLWAIWFAVANTWPVSGKSPRVTQGFPPLAPDLIPINDDRQAFGRALREVGEQMLPTGRAILGLAMGSPWLTEVGGTSLIVHMHGEAGTGKSIEAHAAAALYGDPREDEALFSTFNASGQGLTAWAQELSYFPMMLDEVQSSTSSPEDAMTPLVMNASRKRATRSGQSAGGGGSWRGLIVSTGNDHLDLKHEMFARRLLQVEANSLWDGGDRSEEEWAAIWDKIMTYAGHPWAETAAMFTPGQPSAAEFNSLVAQAPAPGPGSLGTAGRVAIAGSWVLGDLAGMDWAEGIFDAFAGLIVAKSEEVRDPARDVARAIIDSIVTNPQSWQGGGEFGRDLIGQPAKTTEGKHCGIEHEGRCHWLDVFDGPFDVLSDGLSRERLGKTRFRQALLTVSEGRLSRRVRLSGGIRATVLTVCAGALDVLGEVQPMPTLKQPERIEVQTKPELPEAKPEPLPMSMHIGGDDLLASVNAAADAGATDVAVSHGPDVNSVKAEWNTNWLGAASGMMDRKRDGARLRVWPAPHTGLTAQEWGDSVVAYRTKQPTFVSPSQRVHELLIDSEKKREPRWQLPSEQAKLWVPGEVAHPSGWQSKADVPDDHVQYDRNKAHLAAIGQANLAPLFRGESFEVYGPDAPVDSKHAGMYRIIVPEWDSVLPGPLGNITPGSEVWTTAEIMRLFAEADMRPEVIEAHLAPVHRISQVQAAQREIKRELRRPSSPPARTVSKLVYQAFAGSITSEYAQGKRGRVYRPDWGQAIRDNAWATVVRSAWRIYEADPRFIPFHVNVDALYYPAGLGEVPVITIGDDLGEWKVES